MVCGNAHEDDRARLADAAMVAYRRFMTPSPSEKCVRRLWELHPQEHAAWRAVVDALRAASRDGTASETREALVPR